MRQKRNRQRTIFEVLGKNPGPKEFEQMSLVLDANPEILDMAFSDLTRGRRTDTGRKGMTAEQTLRCTVVKQSRELTYDELEFGWPTHTPCGPLPDCTRPNTQVPQPCKVTSNLNVKTPGVVFFINPAFFS